MGTLLNIISSFTLQEREKRVCQQYVKIYNKYAALGHLELHARYIDKEVRLEFKGHIVVYGFIIFLISIVVRLWSNLFNILIIYFTKTGVKVDASGELTVTVVVIAMLLCMLLIILCSSLFMMLHCMKKEKKELYIIENVIRMKLEHGKTMNEDEKICYCC